MFLLLPGKFTLLLLPNQDIKKKVMSHINVMGIRSHTEKMEHHLVIYVAFYL